MKYNTLAKKINILDGAEKPVKNGLALEVFVIILDGFISDASPNYYYGYMLHFMELSLRLILKQLIFIMKMSHMV